ncbi:hypothetical protein [Streptomyces montanisoli]|uniref:Uncharacterized protein n=1 Tax=Streptomyces montanisoli TaxID=2798581 RepID=A0A940M8Y3_9ACTN|nr:hypothetical protein [Streptomyces montanisoli]MBP0458460.1 hypothetical protein [Streptomyces montanisoli]
MQVLFLALGASRKRAVLAESADLAAAGAQVVVLVHQKKSWNLKAFAPGVAVHSAAELEARHLARRVERAVLYRAPGSAARALDRGPLKSAARRSHRAYKRRVAGPVHRRVFMPLHRRLWPTAPARMVRSPFGAGGVPELLVVSDALSVQRAVSLVEAWAADGLPVPRICYGIDYDAPVTTAPATASNAG